MFTGIVTELGTVTSVYLLSEARESGKQVEVSVSSAWLADLKLGDSIAVSGACMTVVKLGSDRFSFDISPESLRLTAGLDAQGSLVNLEKAMAAGDRFGGHMVTGHVDGLGEVLRFDLVGADWRLLTVRVAPQLARYLAYKGSVVINGVSLTVNQVRDTLQGCEIDIQLIPHTLEHTNLHMLTVGSKVNVEVDLVARYLERMLTNQGTLTIVRT
jgi:riboflavin synthase